MHIDHYIYDASVKIFNEKSLMLALKPGIQGNIPEVLKENVNISALDEHRVDRTSGIRSEQFWNRHGIFLKKLSINYMSLVIRIILRALHKNCRFTAVSYPVVISVRSPSADKGHCDFTGRIAEKPRN